MRIFLVFSLLFLGFITACGSDTRDHESATDGGNASAAATDSTPAAEPASATPSNPMQRAELGYHPDPALKKQLQAELLDIATTRKQNESDEQIPAMINELTSLFRSLSVTARALDRHGDFQKEINTEISRFRQAEVEKTDDAAKIMNAMSGVYQMYALLAKMKFLGQPEKQEEIQKINDITVQNLRPGSQAVEAAASIADACYNLTSMIMQDIDSENRFAKAFEQIERQYQQGIRVAKKEEDHYINGMFRTFEVSQLWALSLNPEREKDVAKMNKGVSDESAEAETVGTQMNVATRYLFFISYIIAEDTVELTL
ncbi:hypothetical protein KQI65_06380 [bacterium]|nr:hypothetical protein [bacterium]